MLYGTSLNPIVYEYYAFLIFNVYLQNSSTQTWHLHACLSLRLNFF